jgi:hypothetical protein
VIVLSLDIGGTHLRIGAIELQAAFWPPDFVSSRELHLSPEHVH